jgi:hypothetical protein
MELTSTLATAVPLLQWTIIVSLILVAGKLPFVPIKPKYLQPQGLAWSFILWVVPIIKVPVNSSRSAIVQFEETIRRGGLILAPVCISLAASLALTSFLASKQLDPVEAATWKTYALACFVVVQVGWYETFLIVPVSEKIVALKEDFKGLEQNWLDDRTQVELFRLIDIWTVRHVIRATLPLVSGMIVLSSAVF